MKTIDVAQVLVNHLPAHLVDSKVKPFIYNAFQALQTGNLCIDAHDSDDVFQNDHPLYKLERFNNGSKFYLSKYWTIENGIFSKLKELIVLGNEKKEGRKSFLNQHAEFIHKKLFDEYSEDGSGVFVDWQKIASLNAFLHNFAIITGGPGTGKTTTVAKLLYLLFLEADDSPLRVELVSQTGKAAARLKESLLASTLDARFGIGNLDPHILKVFSDIHPKTIHRLLGVKPQGMTCEYNEENKLPADVIIVDEATMADAPLLSQLLAAIKPDARLYLLGDKNQLSSVEIGSVFSDLCYAKLDAVADLSQLIDSHFFEAFLSNMEKTHFPSFSLHKQNSDFINHIVELKRSYRFNDQQQIGQLAKDLIQSDQFGLADLDSYSGDLAKEVKFLEPDAKVQSVFSEFENFVVEQDIAKALKALNKVKVLCALKRDATDFNVKIEQYLVGRKLLSTNQAYYHNQPIMVTSNDYHTGLYNGDVGLIRKNSDGELRAYFEFATIDGKTKEIKNFSPAGIQSFETAFALTIHKSQGSEFDTVLMVLPQKSEQKLMSKELVYTGLTRAKKQVYIVGSKAVFVEAAQQNVNRISGLGNRIVQHRSAI